MPEGAHPRTQGTQDHTHAREAKDNTKDAGNGREARESKARARDAAGEGQNFRVAGDGIGHVGAAFAMPTMELGMSMLEDLREFAHASAEQIEENIRMLEEGWRELSACESAVDLSKAAGRFSYTCSKMMANASQRMAQLASETAARRMRVGANIGAQVGNAGTQVMRQANQSVGTPH